MPNIIRLLAKDQRASTCTKGDDRVQVAEKSYLYLLEKFLSR
jgi:hypothetical protein